MHRLPVPSLSPQMDRTVKKNKELPKGQLLVLYIHTAIAVPEISTLLVNILKILHSLYHIMEIFDIKILYFNIYHTYHLDTY